eukprot:6175582-Pleurochrysis_carterae.AAC.1
MLNCSFVSSPTCSPAYHRFSHEWSYMLTYKLTHLPHSPILSSCSLIHLLTYLLSTLQPICIPTSLPTFSYEYQVTHQAIRSPLFLLNPQVLKLRKLLRDRGLGAVRVGSVDDYQVEVV